MSTPPDPGNPYAPPHEYALPELTSEARNWAMLCHLSAFLGVFPLTTFGHIVGPLVVWLVKRNEHPFIDYHGKESLNFQISVTLYTLLLTPTICIFFIGIPLIGAVWITSWVLIVIAAMKASDGEAYRYPLTIRLIS
jgi:uncharacterized Tic20 family protein